MLRQHAPLIGILACSSWALLLPVPPLLADPFEFGGDRQSIPSFGREERLEKLSEELVARMAEMEGSMPERIRDEFLTIEGPGAQGSLSNEAFEWLRSHPLPWSVEWAERFERELELHPILSKMGAWKFTDWYIQHLKRIPFDLDSELQDLEIYYLETLRPSSLKWAPEGGAPIEWHYAFPDESRRHGMLHVGVDTVTRRYVCYDRIRGVHYPEGRLLERIRNLDSEHPTPMRLRQLREDEEDIDPLQRNPIKLPSPLEEELRERINSFRKYDRLISLGEDIAVRVREMSGLMPEHVRVEIQSLDDASAYSDLSEASREWLQSHPILHTVDLRRRFERELELYPLLQDVDDWSQFFLDCYLGHVRDGYFDIEPQLIDLELRALEHAAPRYHHAPVGGGRIEWLLKLPNDSRRHGIIHVGIDTVTRRFVCYEFFRGSYYPEGGLLERIRAEMAVIPDGAQQPSN